MIHAARLSLAAVLLACSCVGPPGPDPMRLRADRASHALASHAVDGWFGGKPVPDAEQQRIARESLADWLRRIEADEKLLVPPTLGAR